MFEFEIEALSKRRIEYPLDRQAEAEILEQKQQKYWSVLVSALHTSRVSQKADLIRAVGLLQWIFAQPFTSYVKRSGHELHGKLPLLSEYSIEHLRKKCSEFPMQTIGAIFGECADDFYQIFTEQGKDLSELQIMSLQPLSYYSTQYCIEKALASSEFTEKIKELSLLASESEDRIRKSHALYEEHKAHLQLIPAAAKEAIDSICAKSQVEFSTFIEKFFFDKEAFFEAARNEKASALAAFSETHAFESALNTWKDKADRHSSVFKWGFGLICGVVVFGLTGLVYLFPEIVEGIARLKKPDGDFPYITILLFLLPMIAVGWLLRILGKLVTGALMLKNDAEQRLAMLDTYIRLVHDAKAGREDRTIVLAALFRPLPGHDNDDIQPPSLLDLMKKEK